MVVKTDGQKTKKSGPATDARSQVYAKIKSLVMTSTLKPSASYLEAELAEQLGVSRTPVREAMLQLERDGLVKVRPRHGMTILPISAVDMSEIYQILTELEPLAVELAAKRGLDEGELQALEACTTKMEKALEADDLQSWAKADGVFHSLLAIYSGNKRLEQTLSRFRDQVHRARMATLSLRERPLKSNREHKLLIDHLHNRDPEAARNLHREHRQSAGEMLVNLLITNGLDNL